MSIIKTENCPICGKPTNAFEKSSAKCEGLFVCQTCYKKIIQSGVNALQIKKKSATELKAMVGASNLSAEEQEREAAAFQITKQVANFFYYDETQNKFAIPTVTLIGQVKHMDIYNCSDIIDFELLEDGNSVSKGGVGRALVGGALFGGVGAIVGGSTGHKQKKTCSKMQIKIIMKSVNCPTVYINLITAETKKDSMIYKMVEPQAQEILSLLNVICQANESQPETATASAADEILKYKQLLDMGVITAEEFEAKKKQLLGL